LNKAKQKCILKLVLAQGEVMTTNINGSSLSQFLEPTVFPPGVTKKQVNKEIKEICDAAKNRIAMAANGPFPAPLIDKSFLQNGLDFFNKWFTIG